MFTVTRHGVGVSAGNPSPRVAPKLAPGERGASRRRNPAGPDGTAPGAGPAGSGWQWLPVPILLAATLVLAALDSKGCTSPPDCSSP